MGLDVPGGFAEVPHDFKRVTLQEANTAAELRETIDEILGDQSPRWKDTASGPTSFEKSELAELLLALEGAKSLEKRA